MISNSTFSYERNVSLALGLICAGLGRLGRLGFWEAEADGKGSERFRSEGCCASGAGDFGRGFSVDFVQSTMELYIWELGKTLWVWGAGISNISPAKWRIRVLK